MSGTALRAARALAAPAAARRARRGALPAPHDALTARGRAIGVLLACRKALLLADRTAAAIWAMLDDDLASVERRLTNAHGRHGVPILRRLLQGPSAAPTRSRHEHRVIVETDDFNTHGDPQTFESDRARDAALHCNGWRVLRFTALQIEQEPLRVIATIATVLGAS